MFRLDTLAAVVALVAGPVAGGYEPAELRCGFADVVIDESSGVAAASWSDEVIWTHNDSGDKPRFFAVETRGCATVAVYDVVGAEARDWEDMAAHDGVLYFGDIGDNPARRESVTVYEVAEPASGATSGKVRPAAVREFTYPDGAHNAESLFVDPTTGRLVIVAKTKAGPSGVYRAPVEGSGTLEKVTEVNLLAPITGADASRAGIVIRTYLGAFEWEAQPGDTLEAALARLPRKVALPVVNQGEAIAYSRDAAGLWATSEGDGGPVHFIPRAGPPPPGSPGPGSAERPDSGTGLIGGLLAAVALVLLAGAIWRSRA